MESAAPTRLMSSTQGGELVLNPEVVASIVALLSQADNPDTDVQRQLATSVARLKEVPEAQFYLACILVDCTGQPVALRQRAGLLLKAAISKFSSGPASVAGSGAAEPAARGASGSQVTSSVVGAASTVQAGGSPSEGFHPAAAGPAGAPLSPSSAAAAGAPSPNVDLDSQIIAHVSKQTLRGVCDVQPEIRSTAGSILTTLVGCRGLERCADILPTLMGYLSHPSDEVVDGAFGALIKILEDELQRNGWAAALFEFCCTELLPRLFELASPDAPLNRRLKALTCLNLFAASHRFGTEQDQQPQQQDASGRALLQQQQPLFLSADHFSSYWTTLGFLAMSSHAEVRQRVLAGLVAVAVTHPNLVCQNLERLLPFAVDCIIDSQPYDVKLEALDFLSNVIKHKASYIYVGQALPQLLLLLLQNMRFSQWDYMHMSQDQLEDDNAETPDSSDMVAPRFYRGRCRGAGGGPGEGLGAYGNVLEDGVTSDEDEEDEEDHGDGDQPHGSTWGEFWTVRKAAALLIDQLATVYRDAMLPHVLSLIEVRLQDPEWEVRESAVLALGAIARGCINGLEPFLPRIIEMLFKTSEESKPILRSISVWTLSRFSVGCATQPPVLKAVAGRILSRIMDRNKKVQETACSAFACLEEEAGDLLLPYLSEIVDTLRRALLSFQANSMFVLLDTIGTMAESMGPKIDNPLFVEKLCDPLVERWSRLDKLDPTIIATFECLTCICLALKMSLPRYAIAIVSRVAVLLQESLEALSTGATNGSLEDDLVGCSLNLLSAMCDSLKGSMASLLVEANLLDSIEKCCYVGSFSIKRAAFAFIGDVAEHCSACVCPRINSIVPKLLQYVAEGPVAVCNNASWAIGQIALFASPNGELGVHVPAICQQLIRVIQSHYSQACLVRNACLTMGRVALVGPDAVAREMESIFPLWCRAIESADNDSEKVNAFTGIARVIDSNNKLVLDNMVPYLDAFASMYCFPPPPPPPPTNLDSNSPLRVEAQQQASADTDPVLPAKTEGPTPALPAAHLAVSLPPETLSALHGILAWMKNTRPAEWQASLAQIKPSSSLVLNCLLSATAPPSGAWNVSSIC